MMLSGDVQKEFWIERIKPLLGRVSKDHLEDELCDQFGASVIEFNAAYAAAVERKTAERRSQGMRYMALGIKLTLLSGLALLVLGSIGIILIWAVVILLVGIMATIAGAFTAFTGIAIIDEPS